MLPFLRSISVVQLLFVFREMKHPNNTGGPMSFKTRIGSSVSKIELSLKRHREVVSDGIALAAMADNIQKSTSKNRR